MTRVYIGIGSNIERELHIVAALDRLDAVFSDLLISPVYESEAIGFAGAPFLNLVVGFDTLLSVAELLSLLRRVESDNGNEGNQPKFSARSLDLDLLLYGNYCGVIHDIVLPRADITDYAYALWPLTDIAGEELHPRLRKTYRELREQFGDAQKLWPVAFHWRNNDLSAVQRAS
ncbi:MAG: 2-amino-4-hydroxy-6-hydroxymethyldihydropteridine pyrophosphokinae [Verrucomicrobiaceae bacterium]|nr:2-amino-4-hydroxy-6-hydroxymethyldihydropteridine pyrophosphokinae [Verrucomicrobiaceae bacterium]